MSKPQNIAALATVVDALKPQSSTGASSYSLVGATIDKVANGLESALFCVTTGAKSGSPSAVAVQAKLQDSADGSAWADVSATLSPLNPAVAPDDIDDENQRSYLAICLTPLRRYVRLVFTVTLTGGSSPAILLAASAVLGGGVSIPPTHA